MGSWESLLSAGTALRVGLGQLEELLLQVKAKTQHTGMGMTLWADDTGHNLIQRGTHGKEGECSQVIPAEWTGRQCREMEGSAPA